jgi:hypothetical protein
MDNSNMSRAIARYVSLHGDDDVCTSCYSAFVVDGCKKCGEGVCGNDACCLSFPDRNQSAFIVCNTCSYKIDKKLKLVIDMGKIELLKQKIQQSTTIKQRRSNSNSFDSASSVSEN